MNSYIIKSNHKSLDASSHVARLVDLYVNWANKQGIDCQVTAVENGWKLKIDFNLDAETGVHRFIDSCIEHEGKRITTFPLFYNELSGEPPSYLTNQVRSYIFTPYKRIRSTKEMEITGEKVTEVMGGEVPWLMEPPPYKPIFNK